MKKITLILMAGLLTGGCANTQALNELRQQNVVLQKELRQMRTEMTRQPTKRTTAPVYRSGLPHGLSGRMPMAAPAPRHAVRMIGIPQNWGFLDNLPRECANTSLKHQILNRSGHHLELWIDDEPIRIQSGSTVLPFMPQEDSEIWICLDPNLGPQHTIKGYRVTRRGMKPVRRTGFRFTFSEAGSPRGTYTMVKVN